MDPAAADVPGPGPGLPNQLGARPEFIVFGIIAAFLCIIMTSFLGPFPISSGLLSASGFGLATQAGGLMAGGAGQEGKSDAAAGAAVGQASGAINNVMMSVRTMLGLPTPLDPSEDESSGSSYKDTTPTKKKTQRPRQSGQQAQAVAHKTPPSRQGDSEYRDQAQSYQTHRPARPSQSQAYQPKIPVANDDYDDDYVPPQNQGYQQNRPGAPLNQYGLPEPTHSPHSPTVGMKPPQGYEQDDDQTSWNGNGGEAQGEEKKHHFRNIFHRKEKSGEKKHHHFHNPFHHKDTGNDNDDGFDR